MKEKIRKIMDNELDGEVDSSERASEKIADIIREFNEWYSRTGIIMCESDVGHLWYEFPEDESETMSFDDIFNHWWDNVYLCNKNG